MGRLARAATSWMGRRLARDEGVAAASSQHEQRAVAGEPLEAERSPASGARERTTDAPVIWVLNLRRSVDRREYMDRHLRELGLSFERVESVDGHALTRDAIESLYDPAGALRMISRELTRGEIGCALTHLQLYQRMLDEDVPAALILEDDVVIEPAFLEMLWRLDRFPEDWELILFFHNGGQASRWGRRPLDATHQLVRFASHAWGTGGYLLKQSAARKLLRVGYPVRMMADSLTGGSRPSGVALYGVWPPPIRELPSEQAPSTMPEAHAFRGAAPTPAQGWLRYGFLLAQMHALRVFHSYRPLPRRATGARRWRDWLSREVKS